MNSPFATKIPSQSDAVEALPTARKVEECHDKAIKKKIKKAEKRQLKYVQY